MSDTEQKEQPQPEQPEQPKKPKKTRDLREYLKSYYRNNKEKYVESNRRRREKLGLIIKPDKFKLTIIDSDTCKTLYTKTYKSQKEICEDLNLPAHKVCRIYKKNNSPNYIIEKIN